jgi:hypothetical protein
MSLILEVYYKALYLIDFQSGKLFNELHILGIFRVGLVEGDAHVVSVAAYSSHRYHCWRRILLFCFCRMSLYLINCLLGRRVIQFSECYRRDIITEFSEIGYDCKFSDNTFLFEPGPGSRYRGLKRPLSLPVLCRFDGCS